MTVKNLPEILAAHSQWLKGQHGKKADLSRADLSRADLSWANLSEANLLWANLSRAALTNTVLDPLAKANADVAGFAHDGEYIVGYRTQRSHYMGGDGYTPGKSYTAAVFAVGETECHPGLYLCPSIGAIDLSGPYIKVWARKEDVHRAGNKWRARRFTKVESCEENRGQSEGKS